MIDRDFLNQLATKNQTTLRNIFREYYQNLFLSYFYQAKKSEQFFFKGGTALRIVFHSPRFSEDLDFTATGSFLIFENILEEVLINLQKEGIEIKIIESKKTTGGFFTIIQAQIYKETIQIQVQASKRKKNNIKGERTMIISDFVPSFTLQILERQELFLEKIEAFLLRRKIRDFFDLYFIFRSGIKLPILHEKGQEISKIIKSQSSGFFELKEFLPKNFWPVIKDLKNNLISELEKQNFFLTPKL